MLNNKTNESVYSKKVQYLMEVKIKVRPGRNLPKDHFTAFGDGSLSHEEWKKKKRNTGRKVVGSKKRSERLALVNKNAKKLIAARRKQDASRMSKEQEGRDANPRPNKK